MKKLKKSKTNRFLGGVLGGIAEYFDMDAKILRIIVFIVGLFNPFAISLLYLILSLIIPYEDTNGPESFYSDFFNPNRDKTGKNSKDDRKELTDVEEK